MCKYPLPGRMGVSRVAYGVIMLTDADLEHPADDDASHVRLEVAGRVGEVPGGGRQLSVLGLQQQRQHAPVVAQHGVGERPTTDRRDRRRRRGLVAE